MDTEVGLGAATEPMDSVQDVVRHNFIHESLFSVMNGVLVGMILYSSQVIAKTCLDASPTHLAFLTSAFPCGAFLGTLWAALGRRWGMHQLVLRMALLCNLPLFFIPWCKDSAIASPATLFTILMTCSLLLFSAVRMGQSSLYRSTYPLAVRGRILGWLIFWLFLSQVPTAWLAGRLVDRHLGNPDYYRWLYPITASFGLIGCLFFARLRLLDQPPANRQPSRWGQHWRQIFVVLKRDHSFRTFQIGYFLNGAAFFMSSIVLISLCNDDLHMEAWELALVTAVIPQLVLALASPLWGRILDRLGIVRMRVLICMVMTIYLGCFFVGLQWHWWWLIYLGAFLRGISEGGGQVTWALASVQFAPHSEDVPTYNSIHFTLNGIRGLVMPWVGIQLMGVMGAWTVLVATGVSALSIFVGLNLARSFTRSMQPNKNALRAHSSASSHRQTGTAQASS